MSEGNVVDLGYSAVGALGNAVFLWKTQEAIQNINDRIWSYLPKDNKVGAGVLICVNYWKACDANPDLPGTTDIVIDANVITAGYNPKNSGFALNEAKAYESKGWIANPPRGYTLGRFYYWCEKDPNSTTPPYGLKIYNVVWKK
jgi:hypothetical protein